MYPLIRGLHAGELALMSSGVGMVALEHHHLPRQLQHLLTTQRASDHLSLLRHLFSTGGCFGVYIYDLTIVLMVNSGSRQLPLS